MNDAKVAKFESGCHASFLRAPDSGTLWDLGRVAREGQDPVFPWQPLASEQNGADKKHFWLDRASWKAF